MQEVITSEQNKKVKTLKKLYSKKKRRKKGKFILEGYRITAEALRSQALFDNVFMSPNFYKSEPGQTLLATFKKKYNKDALVLVEENLLAKIADTNSPQGVIAVVNEKEYRFEEIFSKKRLLLLDRVQDPGNMGTIIRTAVAAGIDGIIILKGSVDIYNLKVLRSTMGAIFDIPIVQDIYMEDFFKLYKQHNFKLISADLAGDRYYHQINYQEPIIIAIGNEANGLEKKIVDSSDYVVKIPIIGKVDSLNAAIATGIIIYKALEDRLN